MTVDTTRRTAFGTLAAAGLGMAALAPDAEAQVVADDVVCDQCVGKGDLVDKSVTARKIKSNSIFSTKIVNGSIQSVDLAEDAVFGRVILVRNDASDNAGNCDDLLDTLTGITDNDADNRYTVWLEPGIYDCGATPVQMKPYVDIAGSGRNVTLIRGSVPGNTLGGAVRGADNVELRSLTVENTVPGGSADGIDTEGSSMRITDVTSIGDVGAGSVARGIVVDNGGSSVLTNVFARGVGTGSFAMGIAVFDAITNAEMVNVTAVSSNTASANQGMINTGNVVARNSVFQGVESVRVFAGTTSRFISTQLDGAPNVFGGTLTCVGAYDGSFNQLPAGCVVVPAAASNDLASPDLTSEGS